MIIVKLEQYYYHRYLDNLVLFVKNEVKRELYCIKFIETSQIYSLRYEEKTFEIEVSYALGFDNTPGTYIEVMRGYPYVDSVSELKRVIEENEGYAGFSLAYLEGIIRTFNHIVHSGIDVTKFKTDVKLPPIKITVNRKNDDYRNATIFGIDKVITCLGNIKNSQKS